MACLLSIIVISHNQKEQLRRCIDSILAMDLPFEHEIIVSDDASTDGTWELIQEYVTRYHGIIKGYQCNSNDCNPANNSQRSGWNRCNAYKHASGKYIAHVDGDDYFRPGADVYKRQVAMLEKHPECSLCLSNVLWNEYGHTIEMSGPWFNDNTIEDGKVYTPEQIISNRKFIINQAFMMRRNPAVDPVVLYGKRYVDAVITFHHLQFGNIVCVDACDYVYVQHKSSVANNIAKTNDQLILWCLGIYIPALIPKWRHLFYLSDYKGIRDMISLARTGHKMQESNRHSLDGLGVYIYDTFNRELTVFDKLRLVLSTTYMRVMHKFGWKSHLATNIMHLLLCKE